MISKKLAGTANDRPAKTADLFVPDMGDDALLDANQVAKLLKISRRTLEVHQAKGVAPKRVRIGPRLVAYRLGDVRSFIKNAAAA